jgi:hypothetical protein
MCYMTALCCIVLCTCMSCEYAFCSNLVAHDFVSLRRNDRAHKYLKRKCPGICFYQRYELKNSFLSLSIDFHSINRKETTKVNQKILIYK